jgi:hypothetical protein
MPGNRKKSKSKFLHKHGVHERIKSVVINDSYQINVSMNEHT